MKKILIVGGTHGDEKTGIEVVGMLDRIKEESLLYEHITTLIANPKASKKNVRFVETNLNQSFGVKDPQSYEEKRAVEIMPLLTGHDFILDFHNTTSRTTCAIVTETPTESQRAVIRCFGFDKVVIMPPGGSLSGQYPLKTVSFEISNSDRGYFSSTYFVEKITRMYELPTEKSSDVHFFRFEGKVSKDTFSKLEMNINDFKDFFPLTDNQAEKLEVPRERIPIFIGEKAYKEDAFLLVKKEVL